MKNKIKKAVFFLLAFIILFPSGLKLDFERSGSSFALNQALAYDFELEFPEVGLPGTDSWSDQPIKDVLANLLTWLLIVIGIVAVISFVIAGLQYLLASGDEETIKNAKRHLTYSIIGIVVALSGYIIIRAIDLLLRAETTNV